jgi:GT2 family glycosyltransferase
MKFVEKYPDSVTGDCFDFEFSKIFKDSKLKQCINCNSLTKWTDDFIKSSICSEECYCSIWNYLNKNESLDNYKGIDDRFKNFKEELKLSQNNLEIWKDIIIVVKDQLDYFKKCIESVYKNTINFNLYIWDNGSKKETEEYIKKLFLEYNPDVDKHYTVTTIRSEGNTGFIHPNNELAALGSSPYLIFLNSDTVVSQFWDSAMVGFLKENENVAQVGYWGGYLDSTGLGFGGSNGFEVDYISGWCFCISRETYSQFGLFSDKLKFAYFEDSDFSLRLKKSGKQIYSLYLPLVYHYGNKTIKEVEKDGVLDLKYSFDYNHNYFRNNWKDYLKNDRVLIKKQ